MTKIGFRPQSVAVWAAAGATVALFGSLALAQSTLPLPAPGSEHERATELPVNNNDRLHDFDAADALGKTADRTCPANAAGAQVS